MGDDVGPEKLKLHDEASLSRKFKLLKELDELKTVVSTSEREKLGTPQQMLGYL